MYTKEMQLYHNKRKGKKSDTLDSDYTKWLSEQSCIITGKKAPRGIGMNDIHIHHIYSRNKELKSKGISVELVTKSDLNK